MYRCALAGLLAATLLAPAAAQMQRNFPATALRGNLAFGQPPEITLNGKEARLAPGARVRGPDNLLQMSAALMGGKYVVNYTFDLLGNVMNVWLLRPEEAAVRPWPRTPEEASAWAFDATAQTWTKP